MLSKVGIEAGEVIVCFRDARGSSRASVEDFPVNSL